MKVRHAVLLGEFLHILGGGLRVHGLWAVGLGKDIDADCMAGLLLSKLTEQGNDFRIDIYRVRTLPLLGVSK